MEVIPRKRPRYSAAARHLAQCLDAHLPLELLCYVEDYCSQRVCTACAKWVPKTIGCLICRRANDTMIQTYTPIDDILIKNCRLTVTNAIDEDFVTELMRFNNMYANPTTRPRGTFTCWAKRYFFAAQRKITLRIPKRLCNFGIELLDDKENLDELFWLRAPGEPWRLDM